MIRQHFVQRLAKLRIIADNYYRAFGFNIIREIANLFGLNGINLADVIVDRFYLHS